VFDVKGYICSCVKEIFIQKAAGMQGPTLPLQKGRLSPHVVPSETLPSSEPKTSTDVRLHRKIKQHTDIAAILVRAALVRA
jgi:hypothetical protein